VGKRSDSHKHISVEIWSRAAKAVDRYFSILYSVRDMMTCVYNPAATLTTITPLSRGTSVSPLDILRQVHEKAKG
jgi:hypothetical protein